MNKLDSGNLFLLFALISCICTQEIISVIIFQKLESEPFQSFLIYVTLIGIASFFWGNISDVYSKKFSLLSALAGGCIPIYFLHSNLHLVIYTIPLITVAPIARALLASHKFYFFKGMLLTTKTLMRLSWAAVFLVWVLYNVIREYSQELALISWLISLLVVVLIPKHRINMEKTRRSPLKFIPFVKEFSHFGLGICAFFLIEAVFFAIWSFSEKTHAASNFFPFVGGCCLFGVLLSFTIDKSETHIKIIKNSYFGIVLVSFSLLTIIYAFNEMNPWLAIASFAATLGGVYVPFVYDQVIMFYGRQEKGRACGTVETVSSISEICASLSVKEVKNPASLSLLLFVLAVLGYFIHAKQKKIGKDHYVE